MEAQHYFHNSYRHPVCRAWHAPFSFQDTHFIYPVFVVEQAEAKVEIPSMPGIYRYGTWTLVEELRPLVKRKSPRLRAVMLFGVMETSHKDPRGDSFVNSPVVQAIKNLKEAFGQDLLVCVDVCLCGYTSTGHCGILKEDGSIELMESLGQLSAFSLLLAQTGADVICPSDMMDGRVNSIKEKLMEHKLFTPILSYSAKYCSSFYGPFRDAASSGAVFGDRSTYQLPIFSRDLGIRAALRDVQEGADFVMIKPAMPYLDIIRDIRNEVRVPIACYQVSGEYTMIFLAARAGAFDMKKAVFETLTSFQRAGCSIIITYFTPMIIEWLGNE